MDSSSGMDNLEKIAQQHWDVIIVGTGMGGATLGYPLAKAGKRVLFLEKGRSHLNGANALTGAYAESSFPTPAVPKPEHRHLLAAAGRSSDPLEDRSGPRPRNMIPFIGIGTGGSSTLYGMAMERFFCADFQPQAQFPEAPGAALPESWPIGEQEMTPYYEQAERLYRVQGSADNMRYSCPPDSYRARPPLTSGNQELYDFFQSKGLHPYQLPLACECKPDCLGCQGFICPKGCKNDSARICLEPALALPDQNVTLLDECQVLQVEHEGNRATAVTCRCQERLWCFRGDNIVLAAGALESPAILLRSTSAAWPDGLANDSGLVGRYLMRHCIDLYAIFTKRRDQLTGPVKEIAFNDLYQVDGHKLGSVQSFGTLPPAPMIVAQMLQDLRDGPFPLAAALLAPFTPILRWTVTQIFGRCMILASILEDLPYYENRVLPAATGTGIIVHYRLRPHEIDRVKLFRNKMKPLLKPYNFLLIKQAENNERIAHVCGTCRFGDDPQKSVLNANNRAHGVANLYVVDASFFPSSAGTNPGLTIAANALRVADHMLSNP